MDVYYSNDSKFTLDNIVMKNNIIILIFSKWIFRIFTPTWIIRVYIINEKRSYIMENLDKYTVHDNSLTWYITYRKVECFENNKIVYSIDVSTDNSCVLIKYD
jgi:hypothetical protein